jgi:hypothetical protein
MNQVALHVDDGSEKGIMFLICLGVTDSPDVAAKAYQGWQAHYKILGVYERHVLEDKLRLILSKPYPD